MSQVTTEADVFVSFDVDGDTGTAQTIVTGDTLTIKNATGGAIKTVAEATDTLTIDLTVSGVTAASYTSTDLTVDAQGRITTASSGSGGGGYGEGGTASFRVKWPSQTQVWWCMNEAPFGHDTGLISSSNKVTGTTQGAALYYPIYCHQDMTIDYVAMFASTSGSNITNQFSIYASDAEGLPTGASLLDFDINVTSTTPQWKEVSVSDTALTKGFYWLGIDNDVAFQYCGALANPLYYRLASYNQNYPYGGGITPFMAIPLKTNGATTLNDNAMTWFLKGTSGTLMDPIDQANLDTTPHRDGRYAERIMPAFYMREST